MLPRLWRPFGQGSFVNKAAFWSIVVSFIFRSSFLPLVGTRPVIFPFELDDIKLALANEIVFLHGQVRVFVCITRLSKQESKQAGQAGTRASK